MEKTSAPNSKLANFCFRNIAALILSIFSFFFLIPGVFLSMLTINTQGAVNAPLAKIGVEFFDTSNSILQTIVDLFSIGYYFVAIMIFVFSVLVPIVKGVLFIYALLIHQKFKQEKIMNFLNVLGKWSMCDVFIVAIFLAYLSTGSRSQGNTQETSILGIPVDINIQVNMTAHLDIGFYCFLTYCLMSLIALQLFKSSK